jgi:hypothetical protein
LGDAVAVFMVAPIWGHRRAAGCTTERTASVDRSHSPSCSVDKGVATRTTADRNTTVAMDMVLQTGQQF